MNIAFVSPEVAPFSRSGGLADVARALPAELAALGHRVTVYTPYYRSAKKADPKARALAKGAAPVGGESVPWTLYAASQTPHDAAAPEPDASQPRGSLQVYFIGCDAFFDRDGLYGSAQGEYPDSCSRFVFFCQACLAAAQARDEPFDLWHCHDWQTALIPVYLKTTFANVPRSRRAATVFTIHNLAYRGLFWHWDWPLLNLPWQHFNWREMEFHGKMSLLKGALVHADVLTTVSPTYAREIQTAEFGYGLEGLLAERKDKLCGIVHGIDTRIWNPRTDALLPATYSPESPGGKRTCKQVLRSRFDLAQNESAVVGMIGRIVDRKGFDLVAQSVEHMLQRNLQLVVLGTGQEEFQQLLQRLQAANPKRVATAFAFDNALAHLIAAGSDILLMPSRHEPCGEGHLQAMAYGTPPLVRRAGGPADTVTDVTPETLADGTATGFQFQEYTADAMLACLDRALAVFCNQPDTWKRIQLDGMLQDWSWRRRAISYAEVYERALERK
ncbi:MAG: glycogen/starch synthase [Planctomycetota bacterium]|nr:glycogen/starch synthase [Planctomycetota bacterium]